MKTVLLAALASSIVWAASAETHACSRGFLVWRTGFTGADGLAPTDVAPWLGGYIPAGARYVLRQVGGAEVEVAVREHPAADGGIGIVEIEPSAPLEPHTDYELALTPPAGTEVGSGGPWTFRTGAGPVGGAPPPTPWVPRITLAETLPPWGSSCGDSSACFPSPGERTLEATVVRSADAIVEGVHFITDGFHGFRRIETSFASPFCVAVRERDLAGRRSAPVTICSDEMDASCVAPSASASCQPDGTFEADVELVPREVCTADAGMPAGDGGADTAALIPRGGGCTVAASAPRSTSLGAVAVLAAAITLLRVRRRSTRCQSS